MKLEVTKFHLVLELDLVRGNCRWRELAPFREAVLSHFADAELRAHLALLGEALAEHLLEFEQEAVSPGEPWPKVQLRALTVDLRHSWEGLQEVVSTAEGDDSLADRQQLIQISKELIRGLDRDLSKVESFLGSIPKPRPPKKGRGKSLGKESKGRP